MLYGCVTWSTIVAHLAILRKCPHRLLLRCIGWKKKPRDGYHMLSYADALAKTGYEKVETTVRKESEHTFHGVRGSYGQRETNQTNYVWGIGGGKIVTWEGMSRTGWAVSNATCRCITWPWKRSNGRWQRINRASGSDVLKKRQRST